MWVLLGEYSWSYGGQLSTKVSQSVISPHRSHVYCPRKSDVRKRRCEFCRGNTHVHMGVNLAPKCRQLLLVLARSDLVWSDLSWYSLVWSGLILSELIWLDPIWSDLIWLDLIWLDLFCSYLFWRSLNWSDLTWSGLVWFNLIWSDLI
jgi:hypothetical protein